MTEHAPLPKPTPVGPDFLDPERLNIAAEVPLPADDVREAFADAIEEEHTGWVTEGGCGFEGWTRGFRPGDRAHVSRSVDRILANPAFELRPRGMVTPPADDVREALGFFVRDFYRANGMYAGDQQLADAILAGFEVRPCGTVTDADRTAIERFADYAAAQFQSDLDYDGAEVKRRILVSAHILAPDHPKTGAECDVCRDDDKVDGL